MNSSALFEIQTVENAAESPAWMPVTTGFQEQVRTDHGVLYQGDSLEWLKSLPDSSVDLIFADPPYNIKKAEWDNWETMEAYIAWSMEWISESSRILTNTGSLFVCGFSEILADLKHPAMKYFKSSRWLAWYYKNKANLGSDWGRSHEAILHLRKTKTYKIPNIDYARIPYGAHTMKYPAHPQAESSAFGKGSSKKRDDWTPHPMGAKPKDIIEVPTTCNGMNEKTPHPTQKPEELVRKFVMSCSMPGQLVLDPFSGSGTTAVVAAQTGRKFLACDLSEEYNSWAAGRLGKLQQRTEEQWFEFDRQNAHRRASIR